MEDLKSKCLWLIHDNDDTNYDKDIYDDEKSHAKSND